jgi:hypothetical protein
MRRLCTLAIAGLLAAVAVLTAPATIAAAAAGPFTYSNINSGLCLTARAGSGERPVVQTTCYGNPDQQWVLRYVSADHFQIYSPYLELCLVARGTGESPVVATTCGTWLDQQWYWGSHTNPYGVPLYDWFVNWNSGNCIAARGSGESRAVATVCGYNDGYWKRG